MTQTEPTARYFERTILSSRQPTLAAFLADWCAPCRSMADVLADVAAVSDGIAIVAMDIDADPEVSQALGVCAVPTLILFSDGRPLGVKIGATSKTRIVEWISALLGDVP